MIALVELVLVLKEVVAPEFVVWMVRVKPMPHHVHELIIFIVNTCIHINLHNEAFHC